MLCLGAVYSGSNGPWIYFVALIACKDAPSVSELNSRDSTGYLHGKALSRRWHCHEAFVSCCVLLWWLMEQIIFVIIYYLDLFYSDWSSHNSVYCYFIDLTFIIQARPETFLALTPVFKCHSEVNELRELAAHMALIIGINCTACLQGLWCACYKVALVQCSSIHFRDGCKVGVKTSGLGSTKPMAKRVPDLKAFDKKTKQKSSKTNQKQQKIIFQ